MAHARGARAERQPSRAARRRRRRDREAAQRLPVGPCRALARPGVRGAERRRASRTQPAPTRTRRRRRERWRRRRTGSRSSTGASGRTRSSTWIAAQGRARERRLLLLLDDNLALDPAAFYRSRLDRRRTRRPSPRADAPSLDSLSTALASYGWTLFPIVPDPAEAERRLRYAPSAQTPVGFRLGLGKKRDDAEPAVDLGLVAHGLDAIEGAAGRTGGERLADLATLSDRIVAFGARPVLRFRAPELPAGELRRALGAVGRRRGARAGGDRERNADRDRGAARSPSGRRRDGRRRAGGALRDRVRPRPGRGDDQPLRSARRPRRPATSGAPASIAPASASRSPSTSSRARC